MNQGIKVKIQAELNQCTGDGSFVYTARKHYKAEQIREAEKNGVALPPHSPEDGAAEAPLTEADLAAIRMTIDPALDNYGESKEEQNALRLAKATQRYGQVTTFLPEDFGTGLSADKAQEKLDAHLKRYGLAPGTIKFGDLEAMRSYHEAREKFKAAFAASAQGVPPAGDMWLPFQLLTSGDTELKLSVMFDSILPYIEPSEICTVPGNDGTPIPLTTSAVLENLAPFFAEMLPIKLSRTEVNEYLEAFHLTASDRNNGLEVPLYAPPVKEADKAKAAEEAEGDIDVFEGRKMPAEGKIVRIYVPGGAYFEDYALFLHAFQGLNADTNSHDYVFTALRPGKEHSAWSAEAEKFEDSNAPEQRRDIWLHTSVLNQEKVSKALARLIQVLGERAKTPRGKALIRGVREAALLSKQTKHTSVEKYVNYSFLHTGKVWIDTADISREEFRAKRRAIREGTYNDGETFSSDSDVSQQERTAGISPTVAILLLLAAEKMGQRGVIQVPASFRGDASTTIALRFRESENDEAWYVAAWNTITSPTQWFADDPEPFDGVKAAGTLAALAGDLYAQLTPTDPAGPNGQNLERALMHELKARAEQAVSRIESDEVRKAGEEAGDKAVYSGIAGTLLFVVAMMFPEQAKAFFRTVFNPFRWKSFVLYTIPNTVRRIRSSRGAAHTDSRFRQLEVDPSPTDDGPGNGGPKGDGPRGGGGGDRPKLGTRLRSMVAAFRNPPPAPTETSDGGGGGDASAKQSQSSVSRGAPQQRFRSGLSRAWQQREAAPSSWRSQPNAQRDSVAARDTAQPQRAMRGTRPANGATRAGRANKASAKPMNHPIQKSAARMAAKPVAMHPVVKTVKSGGRK